jgi:peptidoglycan/xylan/chitin deacetylase (PgdA/CDA1 family)
MRQKSFAEALHVVTTLAVIVCAPAILGCLVQSGPATASAKPPAAAPFTVLDWDGHKGAVSFSFDDAQPSHAEHYAELQAAGVPMTFYINTGKPAFDDFDGAWTRAARDGHELGNHTTHHCHADAAAHVGGCIMGTALADAGAEIEDNATYITAHYPQSAVWTMASPFGDNGWNSPARTRVFLNRGVQSGMIAPYDASDPFNLPVHAVVTGETAARFNDVTDRARSAGKWVIFLFHTITPTEANWYAPVAIADVVAGMQHARSLGDVWVDTVANVGAYWRGQQIVAAAATSASGPATTWTWTLPPHFPPGRSLRVTLGNGGTLAQNGQALAPDARGEYRVALDAGAFTLTR